MLVKLDVRNSFKYILNVVPQLKLFVTKECGTLMDVSKISKIDRIRWRENEE